MDELDFNLIEAWHRVGDKLRADRIETTIRAARRRLPTLIRPPRAWCLTIRASDTRITSWSCAITPEDAPDYREPHDVIITGDDIRRLCAPVNIDWPGLRWTDAARKLGRHEESIRSWIASGVFQVRYDNPAMHGSRGKPVPVIWRAGPLDPGARRGEPPHAIWGTLWQSLHEKIPSEYTLRVSRVPRFLRHRGHLCFRGWDWICPGRPNPADPTGPYIPCGRRARMLYGPLPVYTLAQFLGPLALDVGDDDARPTASPHLRLTGQWYPGLHDPLAGMRSFACATCWGVRGLSLLTSAGWNDFVTYVSGGLLYGSEVARPAWLIPERKRRYTRHVRRPPSHSRQQVLKGLIAGETYKEIAQRLGLSYPTIYSHATKLYRQHDVHSREQLAAKLNTTPTPTLTPAQTPTLTEHRIAAQE